MWWRDELYEFEKIDLWKYALCLLELTNESQMWNMNLIWLLICTIMYANKNVNAMTWKYRDHVKMDGSMEG